MLPSEGQEDLDDELLRQLDNKSNGFQTLHRPSQHYEQADSSEREREKQREAKSQARTI